MKVAELLISNGADADAKGPVKLGYLPIRIIDVSEWCYRMARARWTWTLYNHTEPLFYTYVESIAPVTQ